MASITTAAPQFLVNELRDALAFYEERLRFARDFVYTEFYASVSRGGATIHLKCAPKRDAERAHRKAGEHLDAHIAVSGIQDLHDEFVARGTPVLKPLEERGPGVHGTSMSRIRTATSSAFRKRLDKRLQQTPNSSVGARPRFAGGRPTTEFVCGSDDANRNEWDHMFELTR